MSDDKLDRFISESGDLWVIDEDAGIEERLGDVSEAAKKRAEDRGLKIGSNRRIIPHPE